MSDVLGPNPYLPGQERPFQPDGTVCDHCDEQASHAVVGETDSFGSEILHLCNVHYAELRKSELESREKEQLCDLCQTMQKDVRAWRDPEEGSCGPVYRACTGCIRSHIQAFVGDDGDLPETDILDDIEDYLPEDDELYYRDD